MPRVKKSDQLLSKLSHSLDRPGDLPHRAPEPAAPADPAPPPPAAAAAPASPTPPPAAAAGVSDPAAREAAADELVKRHIPYALGAGLLPLPLLDVAAISGVQLKLIAELSTLYGVEFTPHRARNVVVALLGGAGAWSLAAGAFGSAAKALPGVGTFFGAGTLPLMAGAITYATGRVFIRHFESGGTLLNFDADAMRGAFVAKLEEGKILLRSL